MGSSPVGVAKAGSGVAEVEEAPSKGVSHPIFRRKPNASHMCARIKISHI
jgi:hypothetical protein